MFFQEKIKKKILQLFLFFLFLIITVILFQKFNKYFNQNDIAKISILLFLSFITFFGSLFNKLTKPFAVILFYFILILYLTNSLLVFVDYNSSNQKNIERILKDEGKKFDNRSLLEVVLDERKQGKEIYPHVVPREFLKKRDEKLMPLTPMPNTEYVSCNEYGKWKKIKTDRLGFNNEFFKKKFDVLIVGDSFAEGSCVQNSFEPTKLFKNHSNKNAYSIGISGNGPFLSLALAHEVKDLVDFDYLVWFIYDNDFYDIKLESKSDYLKKYTEKNFINNNYFLNFDEVIEYQKNYINKNLNSFKTGYSIKESLLELKAIIYKINKIFADRKIKESYDYNDKNFQKIFHKIKFLYSDKKIFVVYLPETSCFEYRSKDCDKRFLHLKNSSSKINFINFYEYIRNDIEDYKIMYALGQKNSHFSEYGYTRLIKFIDYELSIEN